MKKMALKAGNPSGKGHAAVERLNVCRRKLDVMSMELGIYREIGALSVKRSPLNVMLSRLMDFVLKALGVESGTLYLLDREKGELTFSVVKGPMARKLKGLKLSADKGIAGRVAMTGRPYVASNLKKDKAWLGFTGAEASKNMLAAPLMMKKRVIGVIEIIDKETGRVFTKTDLKALSSLANHFTVILESANLLRELDEKVGRFSALHDIGNLLVSTLDQKGVRRRVMEAITKLMRAEAGALLMVDEDKGELFFEVALGDKGDRVKEVRLRIGEGIAGWVAKHGRPVIVNDVTKDTRFSSRVDEKSRFKTRNMVCVPVTIKDKVIGVMQAINSLENEPFTEDEMEFFALFSNQVAIALDNARLYEEIRETFYATSEALADAIEKRDPYTGGHTKRVLKYSLAIGRHMGMDAGALELLKLSAVLHDIGKIGIEDRILRKEAPLDAVEFEVMKTHPLLGADILKHVPQLKEIMPGMLYHHEKPDGGGYPQGLKDGDIPMIARIISV
ncbi:MAG: GAF domain-containing protein, partial [Deltaproteobacteria bacterium]|nr:GAF domain-containing protein [Deltaproteobacteria bacterium]